MFFNIFFIRNVSYFNNLLNIHQREYSLTMIKKVLMRNILYYKSQILNSFEFILFLLESVLPFNIKFLGVIFNLNFHMKL